MPTVPPHRLDLDPETDAPAGFYIEVAASSMRFDRYIAKLYADRQRFGVMSRRRFNPALRVQAVGTTEKKT